MVSKRLVCYSCENKTSKLPKNMIKEFLKKLKNWKINSKGRLYKEFKFKDFKKTLKFVNQIGKVAESQGHHPDIYFTYGKCNIEIFTHSINGLSENDFELAEKIDKL